MIDRARAMVSELLDLAAHVLVLIFLFTIATYVDAEEPMPKRRAHK